MNIKDIATIEFRDLDSGDPAVVIVRTIGTNISLCLSLKSGADVEVVLNPSDCEKIIKALNDGMVFVK